MTSTKAAQVSSFSSAFSHAQWKSIGTSRQVSALKKRREVKRGRAGRGGKDQRDLGVGELTDGVLSGRWGVSRLSDVKCGWAPPIIFP